MERKEGNFWNRKRVKNEVISVRWGIQSRVVRRVTEQDWESKEVAWNLDIGYLHRHPTRVAKKHRDAAGSGQLPQPGTVTHPEFKVELRTLPKQLYAKDEVIDILKKPLTFCRN